MRYLTGKRESIKIGVHVIIGLPGETQKDIIYMAKELGRLKVDGIKMHPIHIMKDTKLEEYYKSGNYRPLEFDEYMDYVISFLEYLHPDTVIQRITADCSSGHLVAPYWINEKNRLLSEIGNKMAREDRYQGRLYDCEG
jgi:radical SAM protein (TIGR01212 family)